MRTINDLRIDEKVNKIIKKVKWCHFAEEIKTLDELYLDNTKYSDMLFLDAVIALEPMFKQEICAGHISESDMDCFINFYGSVTYSENI
ncbi:MAG: hypothetical protein R3Y35_07505 [Clostridia bacterium]